MSVAAAVAVAVNISVSIADNMTSDYRRLILKSRLLLLLKHNAFGKTHTNSRE